MKNGMVISICGGSGSGKTTLAKTFVDAVIISTDSFYVGKSKMKPLENGDYDFDHPDAVALDECANAVLELARGNEVEVPDYDMISSERVGVVKISPNKSRFVVVEGIFALHKQLRDISNLKIFIDVPADVRIARLLKRDHERGRSEDEIIKHSLLVEDAYKKHIEPMRRHADTIFGI